MKIEEQIRNFLIENGIEEKILKKIISLFYEHMKRVEKTKINLYVNDDNFEIPIVKVPLIIGEERIYGVDDKSDKNVWFIGGYVEGDVGVDDVVWLKATKICVEFLKTQRL